MDKFLDQDKAPSGRSRKKNNPDQPGKKKRIAIVAAAATAGILAVGAGVYLYMGQQYGTVYFPNTVINGMDASGKSVEQVKAMIDGGMDGYTLTIQAKDGQAGEISGQEMGLESVYDGTLEQILSAQEPYKWALHYGQTDSYQIGTMIIYDQEKLGQAIDNLDFMNRETMEEPVNAYLSDYEPGSGYRIVPEQEGSLIKVEAVKTGAGDAIQNLKEQISIEELGAYEKPEITSDSPELRSLLDSWNRYVGVTVTYRFGEQTEVLDGTTTNTWLTANENGVPVLDEEAVSAYVKSLADRYNTAYKAKTLKSSYGQTVTISKGNYGWRINQSAESAALLEILRSGESQTREPIYSQTAASRGSTDYGDTYVEINLTAQHLFFYKNGKLLVESDFVSGNESKGWATPAGAYPLTYKQRDATLKGEGYATPVSYWMPFNGGIGLHDAGWRRSFGGNIYKSGGSHGCINLPPSVAKTIYENISSGDPVLCYHLEGTQSSASQTPPETTAPVETKPAETKPAETKPAETLPAPPETLPPETSAPETTAPETVPATTAPEATAPESSAAGPGEAETGSKTGVVSGPGM